MGGDGVRRGNEEVMIGEGGRRWRIGSGADRVGEPSG